MQKTYTYLCHSQGKYHGILGYSGIALGENSKAVKSASFNKEKTLRLPIEWLNM